MTSSSCDIPPERISPKRQPQHPDGQPFSDNDLRQLHDQLASFDKIEWIDCGTRDIVERFMPDLVDKLPNRTTETSTKRSAGSAPRNRTGGHKTA